MTVAGDPISPEHLSKIANPTYEWVTLPLPTFLGAQAKSCTVCAALLAPTEAAERQHNLWHQGMAALMELLPFDPPPLD